MRIGIFGGSFDPVHMEHIRLAESAVKTLALDKLFVMPAFAPPHKKGKILSPDHDRLQMCRWAFAGREKIEVSDYEIKKEGTSYTYLTCRYFREKYPNAELFWLVGTDMLRNFPTWKNPESILNDVTLAVCARNEKVGWAEAEEEKFYERFGKKFEVIGYNGADVSSTKLRVMAGAGIDLTPYTDEKTAAYIKEKKLYEIPNAKEALSLEKQSRAAHSLRVAFLAAERAGALGIPERQAIAAALFHDCGKNVPIGSPLLKGFRKRKEWGDIPPPVLHQFTGAYLARKAFGVTDEKILDAIRYHTSGKKKMTALGKLVFLADMVEEERAYEGVEVLRELFHEKRKGARGLDKCLSEALKQTVEFLQKKEAEIYPLTVEACRYYENAEKRDDGKTEDCMENNNTTSKELALAVCNALSDKRGKDIVCLYVREKTDLCDYFVIASGSNAPQIKAMGERVEELIEKDLGLVPSRTEGVRDGRWAVIDYGDVIVHIFNDETRLFYHLERLWTDGGNLERYDEKTGKLESVSHS
ncbi:MAG: nicotinate (nicotinamide) nucleotide adenylyltransferase [Clostridia bacterium]|nr:nicotinate (nicotinamide) nucleotide adenylyltransferase [Clostridia bacterium]